MKRSILLIAVIAMALSASAQYRHAGNILLTTLGDTKQDTLLSKLVQKVGDDPKGTGATLNFESSNLKSFTLYNVKMDGYSVYDDVWPFGLDSSRSKEELWFAFGEPDKVDEESNTLYYSMPGVDIEFQFQGDLLAKGKFIWDDDYQNADKGVKMSELKEYINNQYKNRIASNGNCVEGDCKNGQGSMEWESGLKYKGDWKHGFAHGQGRIDYPKGGYYDGGFKWGYQNGQGEEESSSGRTWKGGFTMGDRDGAGTLIFTDGTKMNGSYTDGEMEGEWIITYPQGQKRTVTYENGKMVR